ncbi:metalloregulator ArsR/SmtB family transcription factor [Aeromicrobium sp. S22]|uniref:ArsR/SmtB family transcription factor n=1 Tax=Aeromicrobium sp. S22 TaxID=2662029 RepID=UPI0013C1C2AA|nr:metalloregulator ArsR/SmtB family transcription factor [Aeromicrobium sp. S22]MRK02725.1 metalloregulator ArsR/SmtB family transcription factor [Aeromicrobium sp. S22]
MVKYEEQLDRVFRAMADRTRRAMVEHLVAGPASVSQLADPHEMSMPAVVQHLKVLEEAGIVSSEKVGRVRTFQLAPDALAVASAWLGRQRLAAEQRLDRLGALLDHDVVTDSGTDSEESRHEHDD